MSAQFFNRMIYTFTERDIRRAAQQGEMTEYLQKSQNLKYQHSQMWLARALTAVTLSYYMCDKKRNFVQLSF